MLDKNTYAIKLSLPDQLVNRKQIILELFKYTVHFTSRFPCIPFVLCCLYCFKLHLLHLQNTPLCALTKLWDNDLRMRNTLSPYPLQKNRDVVPL